jgi:ResB-like family
VPQLSGMVRGLVEVVATEDGKLFGRVTNREGIRPLGELSPGKPTLAFGGNPNQPMTLSFKVEDYLPAARERFSYVPVARQPGKDDVGVPAARVELTIDGEKGETWLTNPGGMEPSYRYVRVGRGTYRLAFDSERKPLDFKLRLTDFQVVKEPGTRTAAEYVSKVVLTDEARGVNERPVTISMNRPLEHRGYKLYQSSFKPMEDDDGNETGQYMSIFQIGYDPGRWLKYGGCLLVVLGTFVQFYMRAGVFSDGGKLERARAEKKRAKDAES